MTKEEYIKMAKFSRIKGLSAVMLQRGSPSPAVFVKTWLPAL
jgi:hypothetical protein